MATSRETVLYYDRRAGNRPQAQSHSGTDGACASKISRPRRWGRPSAACSAAKALTRAKIREAPALEQPMLVLDGFTDKRLEILLREMKKHSVSVPYKAIVTETNIGWIFHQLYEELAREHEAMSR